MQVKTIPQTSVRVLEFLKAFVKFSRPHTIIGTTLSVLSLYLIALAGGAAGQLHIGAFVLALLSCLGANVYIVGLNQLTDLEIDRINKPDLPLPAGKFSITTGRVIVIFTVLCSLAIALLEGRYLLFTVVVSLLIGTAYSLPPIRLKRFHFWAAACIFVVRGVVVNIFLYLHFSEVIRGSEAIPPQVWALTAFMFGLSLVIAWFKDIPDMEGDRRYRIITLSLRLGPRRVFHIGIGLMAFCYGAMVAAGLAGLNGVNAGVFTPGHLLFAGMMWLVSRRVDPENKISITRYYRFVWILFFAEYLLFAAACITA